MMRAANPLPKPYSGKQFHRARFEQNSLQLLIVWPYNMASSDPMWPMNGRVVGKRFMPIFTDDAGCEFRNLWVYEGQ